MSTIVKAAAAAVVGIAAITATANAAPGSAAAAINPHRDPGADAPALQAAGSLPVVINCAEQGQTRPGKYILACGDANAYVTGLHWAAWQTAAAFAAGTDTFRVCIPTCTAGRLHSFPVLVTLWRVQALPGHKGVRYFTRMTIVYTGSRSYRAGGKTFHLPQTVTYPLSALGGAGN
ncbi:MAG TPA: hypothetical protein VFI65_31630 [Streptosporangiaceae bacterium]|nr:hypothetical protein [Streptosporangiaceae bacterium]